MPIGYSVAAAGEGVGEEAGWNWALLPALVSIMLQN